MFFPTQQANPFSQMSSSVLGVFHTQTEIALVESGGWLTVVADVPGTKSHTVFPGLFYTLDGAHNHLLISPDQ